MKFFLRNHKSTPKTDVLIFFASQTADKKTQVFLPKDFKKYDLKVKTLIKSNVISGNKLKTSYFANFFANKPESALFFIGIGKLSELSSETLRRASATIFTSLKNKNHTKVAINLNSLPDFDCTTTDGIRAIVEGVLLASYTSNILKSNNKEDDSKLKDIYLVSDTNSKLMSKQIEEAEIVSDCVNYARFWGDMPANLMTPSILADEVKKKAESIENLKVQVWEKTKIAKEKMEAFLSVAKGSSAEPKLIIMEYYGDQTKKKPICLVGKGLTFDSGGISIKPSLNMQDMKFDMCGGANVIATIIAIARLKLRTNIIALVPACENMPGPGANKPGDVIVARNGKTIEVNNTDAEGRLVLADALTFASEKNPEMILDLATLTGAMVIALGNTHTGFFCKDESLTMKINAAAKKSGEQVWQMPITEDHAEDMKGTFADLSNLSSSRGAGSATAAAFLADFITNDIPWAHFDIAGTASDVNNRLAYCPKKGASGVMIRTLVELIKNEIT